MAMSKLSRSAGVPLKGLNSLSLTSRGNVVGILGACVSRFGGRFGGGELGGFGGGFGCLPRLERLERVGCGGGGLG